MTNKKLNILGIDLDSIVKKIVKEEAKNLSGEKDNQKSKAKELKPFKYRDSDKDKDEGEDSSGSAEKPSNIVKVKKNSLPEITLPKIIELLNLIRSGKSLKDKEVSGLLRNYYQSLNGSERVALYAFLTGLSSIVVSVDELADENQEELKSPSQEPYSIDMKKNTPAEKEKSSKPSGSSESPIVVGERADKSREKKLLIKNR